MRILPRGARPIIINIITIALTLLCALPAAAQEPDRPRLRVLTYNIHHGRGMDDVFDYDRLARIINDLQPDLVAVQEVDRGVQRSGRVDQPTILGELTGLHHAFGNALYHQGGEYGEAILSRFPLEDVHAHHLPFSPGLEPRTALAARIRPGGGLPELIFVGTHLCHQREETRTEQTKRLNALFARGDLPVIMAGDLNARPGSAPMNVLLAEGWVDAVAPQSRIDYILYRKSDPWRVVEVQIIDEPVASDHDPVLAVLEWQGPADEAAARERPGGEPATGRAGLVRRFPFDGAVNGVADAHPFVPGLSGQALQQRREDGAIPLRLDGGAIPLASSNDFSIQFWVRTTAPSDERFVILSQKNFPDNSLASQKHAGWVFYHSNGTWAWNMGSGRRRITYERDNGEHMPLNDGRWHQLAMTHDSEASLVRLYYDGRNVATYNIHDSGGFDFTNIAPLTVGGDGAAAQTDDAILPAITEGAADLQELVDAFDRLGLPALEADELRYVVIGPTRLFERKRDALDPAENAELLAALKDADLEPLEKMSDRLMPNPYTIHQSVDFMDVAPLLQIYRLVDGRITIDPDAAAEYAARERLSRSEFDIDELLVWDRVLSADDVRQSYAPHFQPVSADDAQKRSSLTAAAWNIYHGGIHHTPQREGWDSRQIIIDLIRREGIDIVMMQETYSSGDYIAADLGYCFATTIDWDNLNQGANISVLSRFPIEEVHVPAGSAFMNVAARIRLSETQDIWAMSNWYGMRNFPEVYEFHLSRFAEADRVPVLFGGDFNAVPHTDGGDSPASRQLLDAGSTDAYRHLHPDIQTYPGVTHDNGRRIDQLYFKGAGLKNTSTTVISTWPTRFPSDHYLIKSVFELDYSSVDE